MVSFATTWINTFNKDCKKQLDAAQLRHRDDVANGFGKAMKRMGHKWAIELKEDEAKPSDWIDSKSGGNDDAPGRGVDTVDFAMIASHGGVDEKSNIAAFAFNQSPCLVWSTQTRFGDGKLKWLILDCCRCLQISDHVTPFSIWRNSFDGLHTLFGFTGLSSDGSWEEDHGEQFAFRINTFVGHFAEMSDAWIDCAYSFLLGVHPVAASAGRDSKDADNRLETESLRSAFDSIPNKEVKAIAWMWR